MQKQKVIVEIKLSKKDYEDWYYHGKSIIDAVWDGMEDAGFKVNQTDIRSYPNSKRK